MSKLDTKEYSLDLLELLGNEIRYKKEYVRNDIYRLYLKKNDIELLEKYLTELEQIKNSNPREALDKLITAGDGSGYWNRDDYMIDANAVKQALVKAQEQEKALKIIFEKNVDIWLLKSWLTVEQYNFGITQMDNCNVFNLTQEEFDLLKEFSR